MKKRILIIGGGLSGSTLCRLASDSGWQVELHEKKSELGGMLLDESDKATGARFSKFGAHIWHFNEKEEKAEKFIKNYGNFKFYIHKVLAISDDGAFTYWPINLTYQKLFEKTHEGKYIKKFFVDSYSRKFWGKNYKEVLKHIGSRFKFKENFNNEFFENENVYVCLDYKGLFKNLTRDSRVITNLEDDINSVRPIIDDYDHVICTGRIDKFFKYKYGKLGFTGLDFDFLKLKSDSDVLPTPVVNTNSHPEITRLVEYNQLFLQNNRQNKIIGIETPSSLNNLCYPVMTKKNLDILAKYKELAGSFSNLVFHGRLGTYSYENMSSCVQNSIDLFKQLKGGEIKWQK